ncbi:MAG TPA: hypothetical protein VLV56_04520 [Burkholderiales bacterium]|nr:hypothetical protein [Burkholderiales bacterium]
MMSLLRFNAYALVAAPVALLVAACATTTLDGSWTHPEFAGKRLQGPVLVVGVARDDTVRRIYEDEMVARLGARGVKALRSYELVPGALQNDSVERLQQAARKAGATHLLSTAVIGREREALVYQDPGVYGGWGGYRGWYGSYWGMAYPLRTDVRVYSIYIAQTALTDVATDRIDWTARTRSTAPANVEQETRAFVDVIVGALDQAGLLGAPVK